MWSFGLESRDVSVCLQRWNEDVEDPNENKSSSEQYFGNFGTTKFSSERWNVSSDHQQNYYNNSTYGEYGHSKS